MKSFYSKAIPTINSDRCAATTARWLCTGLVCALVLAAIPVTGLHAEVHDAIPIDLPAGELDTALQRLSEQLSLQVLYELDAVRAFKVKSIKGTLQPEAALRRLLKGTDLSWRFVGDHTIAISAPRDRPPPTADVPAKRASAPQRIVNPNDVALLSDVDVTVQSLWNGNALSHSALGFGKPLLETPRSISYVSSDAIDLFSLSAVEDLLRVVPNVFTTTRFGIQGSVDIRGVSADTYFRGMKRLTLQGHGRSVLAAMDSIEVVGGPASPLYGMGKFGGYTNVSPKSGRARTGGYLTDTEGFVQAIVGEYERREASFGFGGPVELKDKARRGGYYVYGLIEDSGSYAQGVPVKQRLLQAATSIDEFAGGMRLETGVNYQQSRTAGALTGRLTQDLVDNGRYIGGTPLVNLDLNDNGTIGYLEMQAASPVRGNLSSSNQPLNQVFAWPRDASGRPLTVDEFSSVAGIPQTMYDYLQMHPEADPTGLLRAQGVGGPTPISGEVPVGMVLDPRSVQYTTYDPRRSSAFEKDLKAEFITAYVDLVNDINPDSTYKNQLFFDSMRQYKSSNQPFSQIQDVFVLEDKFTLTRRANHLPSWLRLNSLLSVNVRGTLSKGNMTLADYGNHRTDATSSIWNEDTAGMTANTTFTSANENTDLTSDGLPWSSLYRTSFTEYGVGTLFDFDIFNNTSLLVGARFDRTHARNTDLAGRFNINTGTSGSPGSYITTDDTASAWKNGTSWTMSLSHQFANGLRPYATLSKASIVIDNSNNSMANSVIRTNHVGGATLKEIGAKGSWLNDELQLTFAAYEQGRIDADELDDSSSLNAYPTATTTRGAQLELRWMPMKALVLSLYALKQVTKYDPNVSAVVQVDARALGFTDIKDGNGNIIYPAEAFLYGGRARIVLPAGMKEYERKQGNPENQAGITAVYQLGKRTGVTLRSNYISSTCSGRLCLVHLPSALLFDAGVYWSDRAKDLRLDVSNIGDKLYYRARTGETLGDVIAQPMPGRRWQLTGRYKF